MPNHTNSPFSSAAGNMEKVFLDALIIKIINSMSSKYRELEESGISKYAMTERKTTRNHLPQSLADRDYHLERQYLQKLKLQRIKTEKLFEEYTNTTKDLKKEREITVRLRAEVQELRARVAEVEGEKVQWEKCRGQTKALQTECQQQKAEIRSLLIDKSTLVKKLKEVEVQLSSLQSLRLQQEQYRMQVEELEEEVAEGRRKLKLAAKEHQEQMESLRERNLELEKTAGDAVRELKKEKQQRETARSKAEQEKELWQQMVRNYEQELQSYSKTVNELQDTNIYLSIRVDEKAKEAQQLKRTAEEHREAVRQGRGELDALRTRLQEKQRKYECLQKDLSDSYLSIRHKDQQILIIQKTLQANTAASERQSSRLRELQAENAQLKEWMEEYQGVLEQRRLRELEHKELLEDELEEISKFERIFKSSD